MIRFLSDDWLEHFDRALREAAGDAPAPDPPLALTQIIDTPTGVVTYTVIVDGDQTRLVHDTIDDAATAIYRQDEATAAAIASGATEAHEAFMLGRIVIDGDVQALIDHRDDLAWVATVTAPLIAQTTFGQSPKDGV